MTTRGRNIPQVAIIGAGSVGSTIAYAMVLKDLRAEVLLADINENLGRGQVKDIEDSSFLSKTSIRYASLSETADADIIIVTAGAKQKSGETRDDLVDRNRDILKSIIDKMGKINKESIWLVVANPVDLITSLAQKLTGLPHNQVLGTGTFLDTQRLRSALATKMNLHPNSIHCQVIGEHGDKQVTTWSLGTLAGGMPLLKHPELANKSREELDEISLSVARRAYDIIDLKGSTHFGIGICVKILCDAILGDSNMVYPVSVFHPKYQVYISYPAVLGRSGIVSVVPELPLSADETTKVEALVENIRKVNV